MTARYPLARPPCAPRNSPLSQSTQGRVPSALTDEPQTIPGAAVEPPSVPPLLRRVAPVLTDVRCRSRIRRWSTRRLVLDPGHRLEQPGGLLDAQYHAPGLRSTCGDKPRAIVMTSSSHSIDWHGPTSASLSINAENMTLSHTRPTLPRSYSSKLALYSSGRAGSCRPDIAVHV